MKNGNNTTDKTEKTIVIIKYNCGSNNHLTIRGEGAGLSWHHGTSLKNVNPDEWIFEIMIPKGHFECKVLINDQVFEIGENHKIKSGQKVQLHPKFH